MRILLVSQYFFPAFHYGGPALKVKAIADGLARMGHEVAVLTSAISKSPTHEAADWKSEVRQLGDVCVYYFRAIMSYRAVSITPGVLLWAARHCRSHDVIHIFGLYDFLGLVVSTFARRTSIPYVVEPMGMYLPIAHGRWRKLLYRTLVGDQMLRRAERVIATSESEFDQLRSNLSLPEERLVVRRNGVEIEPSRREKEGAFRERYGFRQSDRLVLFLGRISRVKNLELLLRAFAELRVSDCHVLLVGPVEDEAYLVELKRLAVTLGINNLVHFHSTVHGGAKSELLSDADLVVLSSHSESFGNSAAEAVLAGVPVVVTEQCGIAPLVRDRVGLVAAPTAEQFGASLARVLTDRALYQQFKSNCSVVGQELSWNEPLDAMDRLYREVVLGTPN